jgi:hypothetical protein
MRFLARERFGHFVLRAPRRYAVARYEGFIDGMCEAICAAWSQWQSQTLLGGLVVEGGRASGGKAIGPAWGPLILARAPKQSDWERRRAEAIAQALGEVWGGYVNSFRAFGLAEGKAPLSALGQAAACLEAASLVSRMALVLGKRRAHLDSEMFMSVADAFVQCFRGWQAGTRISVSGSGARFE